jgi:2-polyprenyl-3-methyl-5-hydroxy-6-metoxy-1,4-benzoquinol methylase
MAPEQCPICESNTLRSARFSPNLFITRCRSCGHYAVEYPPPAESVLATDYHEQYETGEFLESLKETRTRQANAILDVVERRVDSREGLLDFGAGRGWLLETARGRGWTKLAGADTSRSAVESLAARGFETVRLDPGAPADFRGLSFRPKAVTILDVIEHFRPSAAADALRSIVRDSGAGLVVMKVPLNDGVLHNAAMLLALAGKPAILEQMYQVGTWPPHLSYFSRRSVERLLEKADLELLERCPELDFDPKALSTRSRALAAIPRAARAAGHVAAGVAKLFRMFDSSFFLARPRPA